MKVGDLVYFNSLGPYDPQLHVLFVISKLKKGKARVMDKVKLINMKNGSTKKDISVRDLSILSKSA
jgi:hypothetical protein